MIEEYFCIRIATMDPNTSECSTSFFGKVHNSSSTSTPVHRNTSTSSEKIIPNKTTETRKRKLIQSSDAPVLEPPTKQKCLGTIFEAQTELKCIANSDADLQENNVSAISSDNDVTIKYEKTVIASDTRELEDGELNDDSLAERDATRSAESRESSAYETVSETYGSDAFELSDVSSISSTPLDSSDDSVKFSKLVGEEDSVIFVSESCPPNVAKGSFKSAKRMIIIDGSNVAFAHSSSHIKQFSVEGIRICIDHFLDKGFDVKAVVPQMRLKRFNSTDSELLAQLKDEGKVVVSPCKSLPNGRSLISYDDRFILDLAREFDGVIISNDNFRDLFNENDDYRKIIQSRVIGYMFCKDKILFPKDPYGRNGPTADEILTKSL